MATPATTAPEQPSAPLLSLDTLITRHTVVIDGHPYELRNLDEFSVIDAHRMARQGMRLDKLMTSLELKPEEEQELATLLDGLCKRVLDAPENVHAKLRDTHRGQIFKAFTKLFQPGLQLARATGEAPVGPQTGVTSSPDSPASTAAPPTTG